MNKKIQIVLATLSILVPAFGGQALASVHHKMIQKEIDLNGQPLSKPSGFTYDKTTYMPIWYVMSALKHLGIQSKWDGTNWRITTPASEQPDLTNIKVGSGSMNIYINGKLAKKVVGIADIDPGSKNMTMFMPVWYVMQILKTIGVDPSWDGTKWNMDTINNLTDYAPQDIVYLVDQYMTNLNANDDIVQLTQDLYQSGFVTNNFVTDTQKAFAKETWAQFAAKSNITNEAFGDSSFKVTQEGEVNPTKIVIEATETDTNTFTNGTTQSVTQVNDWMLIKDSVSGLWQMDGIYPVSQTALLGMDGSVLTPAITNQSLFQQATSTNPPTSTNQVAPPTNQGNTTDTTGTTSTTGTTGTTGTTSSSTVTDGASSGQSNVSGSTYPLHESWAGYEGNVGSNIVLAGNLAVVADADSNGSVYAYDVSTGKRVWEFRQNTYYNGLLAGNPDVVLMSVKGGGIQALSTATGQPVWSKAIPTPQDMQIVNGTAYVLTGNTLYVYNAANGQLLWSKVFSDTLTHVLANDQQVSVGADNGNVYVFTLNGTSVYATHLVNSSVSGLATDQGQWIITVGNQVIAVDAKGTMVWKQTFTGSIAGGNVAINPSTGEVYVLTTDGNAFTLDGSTGDVTKSASLAFVPASAPVYAPNGVLHYAASLGYLVGLYTPTLSQQSVTSSYGSAQTIYTSVTPLVYNGLVIVQSHQPGYSGDAELVAFD